MNCPATITTGFFLQSFYRTEFPKEALTAIWIPETKLSVALTYFLPVTLPYQFLTNFLRLTETAHQTQLSTQYKEKSWRKWNHTALCFWWTGWPSSTSGRGIALQQEWALTQELPKGSGPQASLHHLKISRWRRDGAWAQSPFHWFQLKTCIK